MRAIYNFLYIVNKVKLNKRMEQNKTEKQVEFESLCLRAGQTQYRIEYLKAQLFELNQKILKLEQDSTQPKEEGNG